jgi:DNA-binding beta-propeller fold protein YncE
VVNGFGLSYPTGVAVDAALDVFIADTDNNRVVEIAANGTQTTVAGCTTSSCQSTVVASLGYPTGVAVDGAGNAQFWRQSMRYRHGTALLLSLNQDFQRDIPAG